MEFNHGQFSQDLASVKGSVTGFLKSLGPSQKKVGEQPVSFFEEQHIRFRLMLVEMGISKIIRTVLIVIVGILAYIIFFRNSNGLFKVVTVFAFFSFAVWMLLDHLKESAKDGAMIAGQLVTFHEKRTSIQDAIAEFIASIFKKK